jgi:small subunit ribosomal protein S16
VSVKIRLMRVGKKKQPTYRVVVADARSPRDGRIIETLGHYAPRQEPSRVDIDGERALGWLRKGAQPTEQAQRLLAIAGVWSTFESEKGGTPDTKLNRRGHVTGRVAPKLPEKEKKSAPTAAPAAAEAEAPSEAPSEEATEAASEQEAPEPVAEAAEAPDAGTEGDAE